MDLYKDENNLILDDGKGKKLIIKVDINGNLDFHMSMESKKDSKNPTCFIIDDENKTAYFAIAKLYQELLDEYNRIDPKCFINNPIFYKERYKNYPVYNSKHKMFKFHSDGSNINDKNFIRFFEVNGIYYIFFNKSDAKEFKLSNSGSRYLNFCKYFNKFYSNLCKEVSKKFNSTKIKRIEEPKIA